MQTRLLWVFRPLPLLAMMLPGFIAPLALYISPPRLLCLVAIGWYSAVALLYAFWSTLFLEYFEPPEKSKNPLGISTTRFLALVLALSFIAAATLSVTGINTEKANEPADLIILPIFAAFLAQNWRASKQLVNFEKMMTPSRGILAVIFTFLAIFYLPLGIGWLHSRLKQLHRRGVV